MEEPVFIHSFNVNYGLKTALLFIRGRFAVWAKRVSNLPRFFAYFFIDGKSRRGAV